MRKDNITKLAKKGGAGKKKTTQRKKTTKVAKKAENKRIGEEQRDIMAKQRVEDLLDGVDLTNPNKEEEVVVAASPTNEDLKNIDWLQEQISTLTKENERLTTELGTAKEDYGKIFKKFTEVSNNPNTPTPIVQTQSNDASQASILKLFNELQNNLMGNNKERTSWKTASIPHLLGTLTEFFPFLDKHKRY